MKRTQTAFFEEQATTPEDDDSVRESKRQRQNNNNNQLVHIVCHDGHAPPNNNHEALTTLFNALKNSMMKAIHDAPQQRFLLQGKSNVQACKIDNKNRVVTKIGEFFGIQCNILPSSNGKIIIFTSWNFISGGYNTMVKTIDASTNEVSGTIVTLPDEIVNLTWADKETKLILHSNHSLVYVLDWSHNPLVHGKVLFSGEGCTQSTIDSDSSVLLVSEKTRELIYSTKFGLQKLQLATLTRTTNVKSYTFAICGGASTCRLMDSEQGGYFFTTTANYNIDIRDSTTLEVVQTIHNKCNSYALVSFFSQQYNTLLLVGVFKFQVWSIEYKAGKIVVAHKRNFPIAVLKQYHTPSIFFTNGVENQSMVSMIFEDNSIRYFNLQVCDFVKPCN